MSSGSRDRPRPRSPADLPQMAVVAVLTGDGFGRRGAGASRCDELKGRWVAHRGAYRILHAIDEDASPVTVLAVEHRRDV